MAVCVLDCQSRGWGSTPQLRTNLTEEDIEAAKTVNGGWTRETLAQWGVPWPPPKGWKKKLLSREKLGVTS